MTVELTENEIKTLMSALNALNAHSKSLQDSAILLQLHGKLSKEINSNRED